MTIGKCLAAAVLALAVAAWTSCSGGEKSSLMANGGGAQKKGCCDEKAVAVKAVDSCCMDKKEAAVAPAKSCCTEKKAAGAAKPADGCCGFCGTEKSDRELAKKKGFCACIDKKKSE